MGEDVSAAPDESTATASSSAKAINAAAKKKVALWNKQAKNLKIKDVGKKIEAIEFCAHNEMFLQEPDVLSQLMGFLSRVKMPEVIAATIQTFETLLNPPDNSSNESETPSCTVNPEQNALFIVEQGQVASTWKGGEPFVNLWKSNVSTELKIKAVQIFDTLLRFCVRLATNDSHHRATLVHFQTTGSPSSALLTCLDAGDDLLSSTALCCLHRLLDKTPHVDFLMNFEESKGISRVLVFAARSERNFHLQVVQIIESLSKLADGRQLLRNNPTLSVLKDMLLDIASVIIAASASPGCITVAEAAIICSCIMCICRSFARVQFGKERIISNCEDAGDSDFDDDSLVYPIVETLIMLLQKEIAVAVGISNPAQTAVPPANAASGAKAAEASAALAAAAASFSVLFPFSGDKAVTILSSLGRMIQSSEKCKIYAKEKGIFPVLLDCFKLQTELQLRQVADKVMHLCVDGNSSTTNGADLNEDEATTSTDHRILSEIRVTKPVVSQEEDNISDTALLEVKPAFLSVDSVLSILEVSYSAQNHELLFCMVRWLSVVVDASPNAQALGERGIDFVLKVLLETPTSKNLLVGYLSKCIQKITLQSPEACETCGGDNRNPTNTLLTFLQSSSRNSETEQGDTEAPSDEDAASIETDAVCKLEWVDEFDEVDAFEPVSLTENLQGIDPVLIAAKALASPLLSFSKWNMTETSSVSTNFGEIIARRIEETSPSSNPSGAKAGSKKRIDGVKSTVVGENIVCSLLEKSISLLQLIPSFASTSVTVSVAILQLVTSLMQLPGGTSALVKLAKCARDTDIAAGALSPRAGEVELSPTPEQPSLSSPSWPWSPDECTKTEYYILLKPILHVLQASDSTFAQIEAAVHALHVMTTDTPPSEAPNTTETAEETERFINVAVASGALVILISLTDDVRISGCPCDSQRRKAMADQVQTLILTFIRLGHVKQSHADQKFLESADSQQSELSLTPSEQLDAAQTTRISYDGLWAHRLLDMMVYVPRYEYMHYPALLLATELGQNNVAKALLEAGSSADVKSLLGTTPLMIAYLTGNEELTEDLHMAHADVDAMTSDGQDLSVWICAAVSPSVDTNIHELVSETYTCGQVPPPLSYFIRCDAICGFPTRLERCLSAKIDVNTSNAEGNFLLHVIISKVRVRTQIRGVDLCFRYHSSDLENSQLMAFVSKIVEFNGSTLNACNHLGQTPLHLAIIFGHADVVKYLIQQNANPNVQDKFGYLPLHYACLGFCDSDSTGIIQLLLEAATRHELLLGRFEDTRKNKSRQEKDAIAIDTILEEGYTSVAEPRAIITELSTAHQIVSTASFLDSLLPWHFACGACSQYVPTLCLDDVMIHRFQMNGRTRAEILTYFQQKYAVDFNVKCSKGMTALHFALKTDVEGSNVPVLDVLLASSGLDINAVHEPMWIDALPVVPVRSFVAVTTSTMRATHSYISSRSFEHKYTVILPNGKRVANIHREQLEFMVGQIAEEMNNCNLDRPATQRKHDKYFLFVESSFSPLHYALQTNDDLAKRLLNLPGLSLLPEQSDLPLVALACAARRSADIVKLLINQQTNMRVHLPLLGHDYEALAKESQVNHVTLVGRKHATALHYAVMYEDIAVVQALASCKEHVNVNVRRSGDGFTPLHLACEMGNMEIVEMLLTHDANLMQLSTLSASAHGVTPLQQLLKSDSMGNEKLKQLIVNHHIRPEMLLQSLNAPPTLRSDESMTKLVMMTVRSCYPIDLENDSACEEDVSCILLEEEERNLQLFQRLNEVESGQAEYGRRLENELEKSNDILYTFFGMLSSDGENGDQLRRAFESLNHRHECFRHHQVRLHWKEVSKQLSEPNPDQEPQENELGGPAEQAHEVTDSPDSEQTYSR